MEHTYSALSQQRSALLQAFRPIYPEDDPAGATRVHLSTERWRACETWFSPGMAGVDAAGLGEVIQNILAGFSEAEKARLVNVRTLILFLLKVFELECFDRTSS